MKFSCSHGFVELWIDQALFCVYLLFEIYGFLKELRQFQSINALINGVLSVLKLWLIEFELIKLSPNQNLPIVVPYLRLICGINF